MSEDDDLPQLSAETFAALSEYYKEQVCCCCLPCIFLSISPQKKYLIYLHQKMRFTPFINYIRYFRLNIIRLQSKIILGHMNSIG